MLFIKAGDTVMDPSVGAGLVPATNTTSHLVPHNNLYIIYIKPTLITVMAIYTTLIITTNIYAEGIDI